MHRRGPDQLAYCPRCGFEGDGVRYVRADAAGVLQAQALEPEGFLTKRPGPTRIAGVQDEHRGEVVIAPRSERPAPASVGSVTRQVILPAVLELLCPTEPEGSR